MQNPPNLRTVLIVEDDCLIARVYERLIRREGWEAVIAADGELAISALSQRRPDLVLLDLMLPKRNGVEVLTHIRSTAALREIPVVVFTNATDGTLLAAAEKAGATKCLIKARTPPAALLETLREFLAHSQPNPPPNGIASQGPIGAPGAHSAPAAGMDNLEQTRCRQELLEAGPELFCSIRAQLHALTKTEDDPTRKLILFELFRAVHRVTSSAGLAGFSTIGQLSSALEVLLAKLHVKVEDLNASSMRTIGQAFECLAQLFQRAARNEVTSPEGSLILAVVTDNPLRSLIVSSLKELGLRCLKLHDRAVALQVTKENHFDLMFLDIRPDDASALIRNLERNNSRAAVVFALSEPWCRQKQSCPEQHDFILKPFLVPEFHVKALVHTLAMRTGERPAPRASHAGSVHLRSSFRAPHPEAPAPAPTPNSLDLCSPSTDS